MIELLFMFSGMALFAIYISSNPLMLCLLLILLALFTGALSGMLLMKWVSYSVILIFLGGMMIIFIYVTSLAGNEKFTLKLPSFTLLILFSSFFSNQMIALNFSSKKENYMTHLFLTSSFNILWYLIIFLLSTLIIVVKMAESFKGALVKFV